MNIDLQTCKACGVSNAAVDEALSIGQQNKVQIDELVQTLIDTHKKTSGLEAFFQNELLKVKAERDEARKTAELYAERVQSARREFTGTTVGRDKLPWETR